MSMTDPVADMLARIRNASKARKVAVDVPASNVKRQIAKILQEEKFIKDMLELPDGKQGILRIYLKYSREDEPIIRGLRIFLMWMSMAIMLLDSDIRKRHYRGRGI